LLDRVAELLEKRADEIVSLVSAASWLTLSS
jgi:hypothetical protein